MKIRDTILGSFILCITLFSCAAGRFQFSPVYDAQMVQKVTNITNYGDTMYSKMSASPDKTYITYSLNYLQIENDLADVILADSLRAKAVKIRSIAISVRNKVIQFAAEHQTYGKLTNPQIAAYRATFDGLIYPLYIAEINLNKPQ